MRLFPVWVEHMSRDTEKAAQEYTVALLEKMLAELADTVLGRAGNTGGFGYPLRKHYVWTACGRTHPIPCRCAASVGYLSQGDSH
jgi:hypothetical protein